MKIPKYLENLNTKTIYVLCTKMFKPSLNNYLSNSTSQKDYIYYINLYFTSTPNSIIHCYIYHNKPFIRKRLTKYMIEKFIKQSDHDYPYSGYSSEVLYNAERYEAKELIQNFDKLTLEEVYKKDLFIGGSETLPTLDKCKALYKYKID